MNAYVFLVARRFDGALYFDTFVDASVGLGDGYIAAMTEDKMTNGDRFNREYGTLAVGLKYIKLRARFAEDARGPFLLKTEEPHTAEELLEYVASLTQEELAKLPRL